MCSSQGFVDSNRKIHKDKCEGKQEEVMSSDIISRQRMHVC